MSAASPGAGTIGDHAARRLAGEPGEERNLCRVERVGDDEHHPQPGQHGLVDGVERGQRGALVAHAEVDQPLPGRTTTSTSAARTEPGSPASDCNAPGAT